KASATAAAPRKIRPAQGVTNGRKWASRPEPGREAIRQRSGSPQPAEEDSVHRVRALADADALSAERVCADAIEAYPLSFELHRLGGRLLRGRGRHGDAARAIRRALYLEPSSVVAHLLMGAILRHGGDVGGAQRAYRNARALAERPPPDKPVPHSDG